jgi:hypothetical protein
MVFPEPKQNCWGKPFEKAAGIVYSQVPLVETSAMSAGHLCVVERQRAMVGKRVIGALASWSNGNLRFKIAD